MIGFFGLFADNKLQSLDGADSCMDYVSQNGIFLLVQGLLTGKTPQELLDSYFRTETLSVDGLEGNFVLVLVDAVRQTVFLYRHLVGSYETYYAQTANGFCFGSNLATLARRSGLSLRPNESMLPVLFLYRIVPGHYTLFDNIFKLLPGELVSWKAGILQRQQLLTMPMFEESHKTDEKESVDRTEFILDKILTDWYSRKPNSAVLLSGGVDSMILQVYWNNIWRRFEAHRQTHRLPQSAAVVLNHPYTKPDFDYTISAVRQLGTEHLNIDQQPLCAEMMSEILSQTGDMPNHVQSFYFATLAEGMKKAGLEAGICGEGADGMFGNSCPDDILSALIWQRKIPVPIFRSLAAKFIDWIKPQNYYAPIFRLANHVTDFDYPQHPQNNAATFTDFDRVEELFGRNGMLEAMRYRRSILDRMAVPLSSADDPNSLLRAQLIGFFGEGITTATYWCSMFHLHGVEMYNPFQDSRLIRVVSNIQIDTRFVHGNPKQVLKKALARHVPEEFSRRPKLGFGQPIFLWLAPGGCLFDAVRQIDDQPWLPPKAKQEILATPNWFLWTLLCYDIWYKTFCR
ncbi:MAG: asparagine synthase [Planctomycetaceae bacterium]|jgi:asparagine synthase (glutamine-hydrolysing)|nr:asparagine synthase [Planctomycetaceae bacterium]